MAVFGLTPNGFNRKRLADIKTELETSYKLIFGDNIDVSPQSVFGQIIGIHSEREADLWEQSENVYNAFYPNTAQGVSLSNLVSLNGITRQNATSSKVTIDCTGTDGTLIPVGSLVSTSDTGEQFVSLSDGTITAGTVSIPFESINKGKVIALATTLSVIDTPIFGWSGANNPLDANLGQDEETDAELRDRRLKSALALGQNLTDSLYGQLLDIPDVTSALVISNGSTTTSPDGIPPHQFLSVIEGGDLSVILSTIWSNTPQGINSYGASSGTIVDSQGINQTVMYTRPTNIDIWFDLTIGTDTTFPSNGVDLIKANMVTLGSDNFGIGDDVLLSNFYTAINAVNGVTSMDLKIGLAANPTGTTNLVINNDQISKYDVSRITVTTA
jgi:uncharacterized phage protein gp47/JayE